MGNSVSPCTAERGACSFHNPPQEFNTMQKMKFGLNVPAKKKTTVAFNRHNTFAQQDPDDEEEQTQVGHRANVNQQLSQQSATNKKIAEQHAKALEEDANIFDYDAVYDDLKEAERIKKEALKGPNSKKVTSPEKLRVLNAISNRSLGKIYPWLAGNGRNSKEGSTFS